jgi:hypothetical protein
MSGTGVLKLGVKLDGMPFVDELYASFFFVVRIWTGMRERSIDRCHTTKKDWASATKYLSCSRS